jgi:hypothetical protein
MNPGWFSESQGAFVEPLLLLPLLCLVVASLLRQSVDSE